jgi:tetratricopeptide (TPR) repeat protein
MKKSKHNVLLILVLLVLAAGFTSCRDAGVHDTLLRAEALMETNPKAARAQLDSLHLQSSSSIPHSSFVIPNYTKRDVADWAWLKVQADYKCDIPLTSDSLALIATDYYGVPRRPDYHAAMAWYTLGCAYTDMQDDLRGIDAFLKAKPLFPDTLNRYYTLCLQNLGKLYTSHYMYSEAEEYLKAFKRLCVDRNDSILMSHADYLLGKSLMWASRFDEADDCFEAVCKNHRTPLRIRHRVLFQKAKIHLHHRHDSDSALLFINEYLSVTSDDPSSGLSVKGDIFRTLGELDSAYACYSAAASTKAEIKTRCNIYRNLAELSSELKKNDAPLSFYTEQYTTLLDSICQQTRHKDIDALIHQHEARLQAAKNASVRQMRLFLNLLALLLLVLILFVRRWSKLRAEAKWQEQKADIKLEAIERNAVVEPDDGAEASPFEPAVPAAQPVSVLDTRKALITLCRARFSAGKYARLYSSEGITDDMDKEQLRELKRTLNKLMDDLQSQLSDDCLNLTRDDIYVCCLAMLGLSKRDIAHCFGVTEHAIYCRYTRLKEKLNPVWKQLVFSQDTDEAEE